MAISDDAVSYNIEYRSKVDDAWWTSAIILEDGKQLRVKFLECAQSYNDEVFPVSDFLNRQQLDEFLLRFRPLSVRVEENECSKVIEGMMVCAVYRDDLSAVYYDAIVDHVHYKEHTPENCECTFDLCWHHGLAKGYITASSLADICFISPNVVDPILVDFSTLVKENIRRNSSQTILTSKKPFLSKKNSLNKPEGRGRSNPRILIDDDRDLGGVEATGCNHYIILENLEKDLSPLLMVDFLHEQTSITPQAYVFPCLSTETYARGAIFSDNRLKIERIFAFLKNPNHFIVSSSGRPWVIAEDALKTGNFNTNLQSLEPKSENKNIGSKLMIVLLGTEEFKRAKKLKDLYMEFRNHLNELLQRLDKEEKKIQHPSSAN